MHLENVEKHILWDARLNPEAASDLEQDTEAFSGLIYALGWTVLAYDVFREIAEPGIAERYAGILGTAIEHTPEDSYEAFRLQDMKRLLGI